MFVKKMKWIPCYDSAMAAATTAALAKKYGADITVVVIDQELKESLPEHESQLASIRWHLSEGDSDSEYFEEVDPTGRYGRYKELLGSGIVKKVYRGFDQEEGIEVAWNPVKLKYLSGDNAMIERLFSEVKLLNKLKNKNIISLYKCWMDNERNTFNFITEVCTSGNPREYRRKHKHVSLRALKKWCKQVLSGLDYLHTHDPCIIHRDLNSSNVFVNGNIGQANATTRKHISYTQEELDEIGTEVAGKVSSL